MSALAIWKRACVCVCAEAGAGSGARTTCQTTQQEPTVVILGANESIRRSPPRSLSLLSVAAI